MRFRIKLVHFRGQKNYCLCSKPASLIQNSTNVYMSLKTPTPSQQAEQSANVYAKANIILQGGSDGAKTFSKTTLLYVLLAPRHSAKRHFVVCSVGAKTFSKTTLCCMFGWRQDIQQNDILLDVMLAPRHSSKRHSVGCSVGAKNNQLNDTQKDVFILLPNVALLKLLR